MDEYQCVVVDLAYYHNPKNIIIFVSEKDEDFIIEQYTKLKVEEIMRKFLVAAKGCYPLRRITKRIFPNSVEHPEQTYNLSQLLRNFNLLQGERTREDMYYVWKYLLENDHQYGK